MFFIAVFFLVSLFAFLILGNLFDRYSSGTGGKCVMVFRSAVPVLNCACKR